MPRYDVCCANGHEIEVTRAYAERHDPCPACGAPVELAWRRFGGAHGDDIPGGMWIENGVPEPVKVYSHSEAARRRAQHGCEMRPHWVPNDRHLTNWAAGMTEKQLRDAEILLSRGGKAAKEEPRPPEALVRALTDVLYH